MKKEVEVKVRIDDPKAMAHKLEELGFQKENQVMQQDRIFMREGTSLANITPGMLIARIRKIDDTKCKFTLKKRTEVLGAPLEYETPIENESETEGILALLEFYETVKVSKERIKYTKDDLVAAIDEVVSLGTFLELEKMVPETTDSTELQNELMEYLVKHLSISSENRVHNTYDVMIYEQESPSKAARP